MSSRTHEASRHEVRPGPGLWPGGADYWLMHLVAVVLRWPLRLWRRLSPKDARTVLFVSERPRAREAKLAVALRASGWRVELLYQQAPNYDAHALFDRAAAARSPLRAYLAAARNAAGVVHVFSLGADPLSHIFLSHSVAPTVYDPVDVLEAQCGPRSPNLDVQRHLFSWQRAGIRWADAVCARDLQLLYARRKLGYDRPRRSVFVPDYAWSEPEAAAAPPGLPPWRIGITGNFGDPARGEADWDVLEVVKRLVAAGHSVDIYPHGLLAGLSPDEVRARLARFTALPNVSLHAAVPAPAVAEACTRLDAGLLAIDGQFFPEADAASNPEIYPYVVAARVFDWVQAGKPVIGARQFRLVRRLLGPAFITLSEGASVDSHTLAAATSPDAHAARLARARSLAVRRHAPRLIGLYERLTDKR